MTVRPTDDEAANYVLEHFRTHDYDMVVLLTAVTACPEHPNAVDVHFVDVTDDDRAPMIFTVWWEDVGTGPFLYGEW